MGIGRPSVLRLEWSQILGLGGVRRDHGKGLSVGHEEILANHLAHRGGNQCFTNTVYSVDGELLTLTGDVLDVVEGMLRGSPHSHCHIFQ